MTLMNRILRLFPKKKVDIEALNHTSLPNVDVEENADKKMTIRQEILSPDHEQHKKEAIQYEILEREIMPEKIICPDCGQITLEGLEYCDKCGGDLTNY